ncbi:MAG: superoxide dismutase [Chitinophagales bacterium]|nr:superoxide dismutase [Chitinophagales bacterium]MDW8428259.1 superoxide dismutase [Chitinophagales bacterium]
MKTAKSFTRRAFLKQSSALLAVAVPAISAKWPARPFQNEDIHAHEHHPHFQLPALPYAYEALEPYIDSQTMRIHHDRHHRSYVDNLNKALLNAPEWQHSSIDHLMNNLSKVPENIFTAVRNNGGGHWNHSFFWKVMSPQRGTAPQGRLRDALLATWESVERFQEEFNKAALGIFGSGWAWLIKDANGRLMITTTPNQDNPLMDIVAQQGKPILGVDVWEHAYYLKHQNRRADYLKDWWQVVNWQQVSENYG